MKFQKNTGDRKKPKKVIYDCGHTIFSKIKNRLNQTKSLIKSCNTRFY